MLKRHPLHGHCRSESLGPSPSTSRGATLSCGNLSKGTAVALGTTAFAYEMLLVQLCNNTGNGQFRVDLSIYDGSNEWNVAQDMIAAMPVNSLVGTAYYVLPLHIPAGSQLRAKGQATTGGLTIDIVVTGFSAGLNGAPGFSRLIYEGTVLVDPGGTINTKVRTELVAATQKPYRAFMVGIDGQNDGNRPNAMSGLMDIDIGSAGNESNLVAGLMWLVNPATDGPNVMSPLIAPIAVPEGSRLSCNCQANGNAGGDRAVNVHTWGLV